MKSKKNGTKENVGKHFFSLFLSCEGGIEPAHIFFYLSAARIKQGIVGYIGLG
jgi:hypothetical protein